MNVVLLSSRFRGRLATAAQPLACPSATKRKLSTPCNASEPSQSGSLLKIPGLGKRAQEKLLQDNVDSVESLVKLYRTEHKKSRELLVQYLESLGIRRRWRDQIAQWIADNAPGITPESQITFCVEGNIGAGKSTWLDMVKSPGDIGKLGTYEAGLNHHLIEVVPEPVERWQNLEGSNILQSYYEDPHRHAFTLQSYVLNTRIEQELSTRNTTALLRLMERSVFCDRMVFVKAIHKAKHLDDVMLKVYDSWFNPLLERQPELVPHGFVYLKTSPDTCDRRIKRRKRPEEANISMDYLSQLAGFHEDWLVTGGRSVQATSALWDSRSADLAGSTLRLQQLGNNSSPLDQQDQGLVIPTLPSTLEGQVVLLDSKLLEESNVAAAKRLHLVPALHVDCEADVDIEDPGVRLHRAQMMEDFRSWVTAYMRDNGKLLTRLQQDAAQAEAVEFMAPIMHSGISGSLEALAAAQV